MIRRAIASVVGFFLGWAVFQVVRPVENVPGVDSPPPQIVAIKLANRGCTDVEYECPVFEVTLRRDGTATYVGYANDSLIGTFEARVPPQDFQNLVDEIEKQRFFELESHYIGDAVLETISLEVVTDEGSRQVTSYSWTSMPGELRVLHALIHYQTYYVDWEEVKKE